ncbi:MAG: carboxypeptidase regulatory-like domain-containing protein [Planctomycetes bacterium]|nr:carboxypeptidase regulatory-like domain-containing protein [Planctomycetota bacterium]
MRPVQAALLSFVLVLLCGVIWWMTRLDGTTPRTAAPLSMESNEVIEAPPSVGDLEAPKTSAGVDRPERVHDDRASIGTDVAATSTPTTPEDELRSGRVLDAMGQPVAGAFVYFAAQNSGFGSAIGLDVLYRSDSQWGGKILRVETDALGRYSVETPRWNPARVAVRSRGHAPYSGELRLPERGADYPDLALQDSVFLEGRVLDHLDRPVEGAHVESLPPRSGGLVINLDEANDEREGGWVSDAAGRFVIDEVAAGPYRLRVTHPDAPPEEVGGSTAEPGERVTGIEVRMGEGAEIRGRVVGVPSGEATKYVVVARPAEMEFGGIGLMGGRSQELAEDGSFRLRGLRKGTPVSLALYKAGKDNAFWGEGFAQATRAMPGDLGVQLQFTGSTGVRLRALDAATGEVVEDFVLAAGGWWTETLSDADGAAIEHHPEGRAEQHGFNTREDGTFDVVLRAKGYEPLERKGLKVENGEVLDLGDVRLKTVPELIVKVVDHATGDPVEAARVKMLVQSDDEGELEMPWGWNGEESTKTDERGIARISSRPGRTVRFSVTHRKYADHYGEPIVLADVQGHEVEVRLTRGGSVEVLVLDASGEPLPRRKVSHRSFASEPEARFMSEAEGEKTNRHGLVKFEHLPAGEHHFRIAEKEKNGGMFFSVNGAFDDTQLSDEWKTVSVTEGGEHTLTLHAPPAAGLTGRILENGRPLVGAQLSLEARGDDDEAANVMYSGMLGGDSGVKTDAEGRFEFEGEDVGPVRLTIEHYSRAMPALFDLELEVGANEVELDLDVTVLRGRVTDDDGKPVVGARVSVRRKSGGSTVRHEVFVISTGSASITGGVGMEEKVLTDTDGRYELRGVAPGAALVIEVDAQDALLEDGSIDVAPLEPREERELDGLQLKRAGSLRVKVSAVAGRTVSFCNVSLEPKEVEGDVESQFEFLQGTGEVRFTGVTPGEWTVEATSTDPRDGTETSSETRIVTIEAGVEARIELVMP